MQFIKLQTKIYQLTFWYKWWIIPKYNNTQNNFGQRLILIIQIWNESVYEISIFLTLFKKIRLFSRIWTILIVTYLTAKRKMRRHHKALFYCTNTWLKPRHILDDNWTTAGKKLANVVNICFLKFLLLHFFIRILF